jgi:pimeloyl-ACP methyl ester carboxylesterase
VPSRAEPPPETDLGGGFAGRRAGAGTGAGERVLWLHGYTLDSTIWGALWERLDGWEHIGVDLPGHGGSADPPTGDTLAALGGRLAALAGAHEVRHVVALSLGTIAALELAINRPPGLASLTLAAPAIAGGPQDPAAAARYRELMALHRAGGSGRELAALWMRSPPDIFLGASRRPALWSELSGVVARHRWAELGDGAMRAVDRHVQPPAALRSIGVPTLVLVGEHELAAFLRCAAVLRATVPDCRAVRIPGAGHLCLLEEPAAAAAAIAEQLSSI